MVGPCHRARMQILLGTSDGQCACNTGWQDDAAVGEMIWGHLCETARVHRKGKVEQSAMAEWSSYVAELLQARPVSQALTDVIISKYRYASPARVVCIPLK